jgi:hypothetical protein
MLSMFWTREDPLQSLHCSHSTNTWDQAHALVKTAWHETMGLDCGDHAGLSSHGIDWHVAWLNNVKPAQIKVMGHCPSMVAP